MEIKDLSVSMIICTYNRRYFLDKLAQVILKQLPVPYALEVIIVNNNSKDDTEAYAEQLCQEHPVFKYVFEEKQGLSHARNAGAEAAKNNYLLYIDDDAVLAEGYMAALGTMLSRHEPDLFGGPVYPDYADPKPHWFPESLEVRKKANISGFHYNMNLSGGNFGIRRELLKNLGGFNPNYGMSGSKVGMLEERLLIEAYRINTPADKQKVYYALECPILHHTPKSRMTVGFQTRRIYLANYQYLTYCLERGIRSPGLLLRMLHRRFWKILGQQLAAIPEYWRKRKTEPELFMLGLIKMVFVTADLHAALTHVFSKRQKHIVQKIEQAPEKAHINILFLYNSDPEDQRTEDKNLEDLESIEAYFTELPDVNVTSMNLGGLRYKPMFDKVKKNIDLLTVDVMITDSPKVFIAMHKQRPSITHIQLLLRVRYPMSLGFILTPILSRLKFLAKYLRKPKTNAAQTATMVSASETTSASSILVRSPKIYTKRECFSRRITYLKKIKYFYQSDRFSYRNADMVISIWYRWTRFYLRLSVPKKRLIYIPNLPAALEKDRILGTRTADEIKAQWHEVIRDLKRWAPARIDFNF